MYKINYQVELQKIKKNTIETKNTVEITIVEDNT
jgi:hypothetical protein